MSSKNHGQALQEEKMVHLRTWGVFLFFLFFGWWGDLQGKLERRSSTILDKLLKLQKIQRLLLVSKSQKQQTQLKILSSQ